MTKDQVLQQCLPGVTLHTSMSGTAADYNYKGYQSLDVGVSSSPEADEPRMHIRWLEERERRQRYYTRRQIVRGGLVLFSLVVLAKWHHDEVFDYQLRNRQQQQDATEVWIATSDIQKKDKDNRDEILHLLEKLDEEIEGDIVLQSTKPKFQEASRVWREGLLPPLAVIEVKTQQDVATALPILAGMRRDYKLDFRIRSGGHNHAGYSTVKDGVVLSLSNLNATTIQKSSNSTTPSTAIVEPGVRVEQFLQTALDKNGLAGVTADAADVGMIGFVLGGGYGFQSRKYGLGIDNVERLRVVLTNGIVQDVTQGDDLFWALRGAGGGNFGVVVEMEYRLYEMDDMKLAANVRMPLVDLPSFLQKLGKKESGLDGNLVASVGEYQRPARDHAYRSGVSSTASALWQAGLNSNPNSNHDSNNHNGFGLAENGTATISFFWAGDADPDDPVGEEYIKAHVTPLLSRKASEISYYYFSWSAKTRKKEQDKTWSSVYAAQSWNGFLFAENNTDAVWEDIRQNLSVMFRYCTFLSPKIELWRGAIASKQKNATAFPYRQALYNVGVELLIPDGTDNAAQVFQQQSALVGAVWPSIAEYLSGVYVNYPMPSLTSQDYPKGYWGDNLERLMNLKQEYDPFHVLRYEQSIPILKNNSIGARL